MNDEQNLNDETVKPITKEEYTKSRHKTLREMLEFEDECLYILNEEESSLDTKRRALEQQQKTQQIIKDLFEEIAQLERQK